MQKDFDGRARRRYVRVRVRVSMPHHANCALAQPNETSIIDGPGGARGRQLALLQ